MAKDYHPLDTRYRGPSTAYRGSTKSRVRDSTPPPVPRDTAAGPWGAKPRIPPPVPPQAPPPKPASPRNSRTRVFVGLAIFIGFVSVNIYLTRSHNILVHDIQDALHSIQTTSP